MQDLLHRILHVKRLFAGLVLAVVGTVVIWFGNYAAGTASLQSAAGFPWSEIGGLLFGAGVLGIWLDSYFQREKDAADDERFRRIIKEESNEMRQAVINGFAFEPDDMVRVATPETLDKIIQNSLGIRLGDKELAEELYVDIRDQAVKASERWYNTKVSMHLSPLVATSGTAGATPTPMFIVTTTWEYTVVPSSAIRHFTCVSDETAYRDAVEEGGNTSAWYFRPENGIDGGDREAFELVQFSVDGEARTIKRQIHGQSQTYTVEVGADVVKDQQPVVISYTYRTLVRQHGHLLNIEIEQPSKGLSVELDYTDCDIEQVRVLPFFPSSKRPRFLNMPESVPDRTVSVALDGWLMPDSGVAMVWVLAREVSNKGKAVLS